jgi:hypothetical protein
MEIKNLSVSELNILYTLRSLVNSTERINVADKRGVFYREMVNHDISKGGRYLHDYLSVLNKLKN